MKADIRCALCNGPTTPTPVSFTGPTADDDPRPCLWALLVYICRRPSCMLQRGASSDELPG